MSKHSQLLLLTVVLAFVSDKTGAKISQSLGQQNLHSENMQKLRICIRFDTRQICYVDFLTTPEELQLKMPKISATSQKAAININLRNINYHGKGGIFFFQIQLPMLLISLSLNNCCPVSKNMDLNQMYLMKIRS